MWAIRILTGPQSGKTFVLKPGANLIGRGPECDIKLQSQGISKRHAEIYAFEDKVVLSDKGSSNGTFANGVKVKSHQVQKGDKLAIHDVVFAIVSSKISAHELNQRQAVNFGGGSPNTGHAGPDLRVVDNEIPIPHNFAEKAKGYFENVVMPGIYKLPELTDFKNILLLFILMFIFSVTSLQVLPMVQRLKSSVQNESQRRALTIAKNLEAINREHLAQGRTSLLDVSIASREEGVNEALIVSYDQTVMAPANKAQAYSTLPFVSEAVRDDNQFVKQISDSLIGASIPIKAYNPETGTAKPIAFAIVIYNMGGLAVNSASTISLYVINLTIAIILGVILYVFLLKLFEFPFKTINRQLDNSLKDGTATIKVPFVFEPMQALISNINSALARTTQMNAGGGDGSPLVDRDQEAQNWLLMISTPALIINGANETVMDGNEAFERLTNIRIDRLRRQPLDLINDQSLKQQIVDLLESCKRESYRVAESQLDFPSGSFKMKMIAVTNATEVAYYMVTLLPGGG